ncbi:dicarboxylate carrier protein MatC [Brevibacterium sanguinis]|uniref:Dicarboxylate carrier protein MatC n=2 Tax=Brevibacterium TaxID=1696 RepID=A0A366IHK0_9MICO|nr:MULTISPECIES: SLC13 family permease [Brevibacterium]RBP65069.1 dicarboxylate carrier protein MatC [Brevibacterium sanguinis]RBP71332.1 dicarboxylate carrier protein MatC [Brevibacterium celere]
MIYFISVLVLVAVFAIATVRPINMGLLGLAAAFIVGGWISGISIEEITSFFPGDMFLVVFGITLLFGIARVNGTIGLIMDWALRLVRGRPWAIVWLMFTLAAVLMALGSVLAVGMLAPIAMPLAKKYRIDPLLMGMMTSHGALAAAFSPITVYSVGINQLVASQGMDIDPVLLFVVPFGLNLLLAVVLFLTRGRDLWRRSEAITADDVRDIRSGGTGGTGSAPLGASGGSGSTDSAPLGGSGGAPVDGGGSGAVAGSLRRGPVAMGNITVAERGPRPTLDNWLTYAAMAGLLVTALIGIDVGVASTCLAAFLLLISPKSIEPAMKTVSWSAVLLVCGIVTYMGVLNANGTIDFLGAKASEIPWPLLVAFVMFLAVGIISAVGSSFGIILISLPLAAPLLATGDLHAAAFVIALSFCATAVDVSPFSTNGVIVLASAQVDDTRRFQRSMLVYTGYVIIAAPVLAWLLVLLPVTI